jgi:DNA-binding NarL/FixJ family response regulator
MGRSASGAAPVRVLVVDDEPRFHQIARELIDATAGFEWVGRASSGEQAIEDVRRLSPDLVLMDVRMPGIGGVEAARRIASTGTPPLVVLITADEPSLAVPSALTPETVAKNKLSSRMLRRIWEENHQGAHLAVSSDA